MPNFSPVVSTIELRLRLEYIVLRATVISEWTEDPQVNQLTWWCRSKEISLLDP